MQITLPGKRPFYKYASPETALAILRHRTLRYSCPLTFNDPFDVQAGLHFDFDLETLHEKVLDRIHELAAAPEPPRVDESNPWGKMVLLARQYLPTHGFPRDHWIAVTRPSFDKMVRVIHDTQQRYREHWRTVELPGTRVFCVSESRDNLLMWSHYAREHTGAVFELWSLPEIDNPLSVARPVEYVDEPPPFFTESEWIDELTGARPIDPHTLYRRYAYLKSKHWSYEQEWRVWYPLASHVDQYDDVPLQKSEFAAIYLGCRATPQFVAEVTQFVRDAFPDVRIFQASKNERAYALDYAER